MIWAIVALAAPALALVAIGLIPPLRRSGRPAAWVSVAAISAALAAAAVAAAEVVRSGPAVREVLWAPLHSFPPVRFGILLDGLSATMAVLVAGVALAVQVYSLGYMSGESRPSLGRYFAYHSLFAFAMLGLVLSHNTLQTYVFWELVGLGSYLLIGFWFERPAAARAALKAFWTTRLGDVGFAVGVVVLWAAGGTFVFSELFERAADGSLAGPMLAVGVAGLYLGAAGKSAQFPFHVWLPDAMEGPTPVSALIHAATMVAAGVYLMVRIAPLLAHTPTVSAWVLGIGCLTAFLSATMALVERDVKRVLAYSTVSQLGYMMAAVGAGAAGAAFFHLSTHALFKALLFLAAGSLIHALHTNDLFEMGGLSKRMPWTAATFLIGALALAGVFPLSGFFSKDEVLAGVLDHGHRFAFAVLLATAFLTAFYIFRAFWLAFLGGRDADRHAHESPPVMLAPMAVLAAGTALAGVGGWRAIAHMLGVSVSFPEGVHAGHPPAIVPVLGSAAALAGIALAWSGYGRGLWSPAALRARLAPAVRVLERRWFIDDLFLALYRALYLVPTRIVGWFDRYLVDGVVNWVTDRTRAASQALRVTQSGRVQDALYFLVAGAIVLLALAARS